MFKRACIALSLILVLNAFAADPPAEAILFGVFHFANPGRDIVRVDQIDVSTPENQAYLDALAERLCAFRPTTVLLEYDRNRDAEMQTMFEAYRAGESELAINEVYQIGFRVAAACNVQRIHGFDENEVGWQGDLLFEYLEQSEPDILESFSKLIEQIQEAEATAQRELSLRELLIRSNDAERDRLNKDLYLLTNAAGAGAGFEGADASARWWRRNFRMYANIQRHAMPGERVLIVAGQGHTAILKDLLEIDRRITGRDIRPFL